MNHRPIVRHKDADLVAGYLPLDLKALDGNVGIKPGECIDIRNDELPELMNEPVEFWIAWLGEVGSK